MIFQAEMTVGKKTKSLWLVGRSFNGWLTQHQEFDAHRRLMRELKTYDEFTVSRFYQRHQSGYLEIVCAGNFY